MANYVRGKNVIVEMFAVDNYYPVFCAKSADFTLNQDMIETTSTNSGAAREFVAGMSDATLNVNGVTTSDNTGGRLSINYLLQQSVRRQAQRIRILMTDDNGDLFTLAFYALIQTTGFSRDVPSYSQSTISFKITGNLSTTTIPGPSVSTEEVLYLDCVAGQSSVTDSALIGATVLEVQRSGLGHDVTTGTPTGRQFLFNDALGEISFDSTNPFNSGEVIYVLYKP